MESYRQSTRDLGTWYGMLCRNKKTGKIHIYALRRDSGNPEELLDKNYESIETRLLTNSCQLKIPNISLISLLMLAVVIFQKNTETNLRRIKMREVYKVADPKRIGIHIEPRPNLDIFVYTDGQRR